jgi:thiol-disulfide isomerase/thioredoxin
MIRPASLTLLILIMLMACNSGKTSHNNGEQQLQMQMAEDAVLAVDFAIVDSFHFTISNGDELIDITEIEYQGDSIFFKLPVFGTEFKGVYEHGEMQGQWHNYLKSSSYQIDFSIIAKKEDLHIESNVDFSGRYRCFFIDSKGIEAPAIGLFSQNGSKIQGTFMTETGDYRYLAGFVKDSSMELSTFDGSHAFWFKGTLKNFNKIEGEFRSGKHWQQKWFGIRDDSSQLSDMKKLTFLKEGHREISFELPDGQGLVHSLNDRVYQNKAVIIQIMGTWCPNCMDESRYLASLYEKYHAKGLEIIALDFEPDTTFEYFNLRVDRYRKDLNIKYTMLKAGLSDKTIAQQTLPMLNKIVSYPTAIFINRQGKIVELHTGFSGPGTGNAYKEYCAETEILVQALLK